MVINISCFKRKELLQLTDAVPPHHTKSKRKGEAVGNTDAELSLQVPLKPQTPVRPSSVNVHIQGCNWMTSEPPNVSFYNT